jgi:hypothetical protein
LIVIEGPITADCFGPLIVAAGAAGAVGAGAIGGAAGLRIGSPCGLRSVGSSFRLFHTLGIPSFLKRCVVRHPLQMEGQLLYLHNSPVQGHNPRNFYALIFSHDAYHGKKHAPLQPN